MNDSNDRPHAAPRSLSRLETFERLSSPIPDRSKSAELPPLTKTRKLTPAEEKSSVEHLYNETLARKKKKMEQLEASIYQNQSHTTTVDPEELKDIVGRLYEQSIRERDQRLHVMVSRRMAVHNRKTKQLGSTDELSTIVDRLYNTAPKERERSDILFHKYNPSNPVLKRSKAELEANDDRYYKGGFAKKN
jgi:hypothetical protein